LQPDAAAQQNCLLRRFTTTAPPSNNTLNLFEHILAGAANGANPFVGEVIK
jgi:hypothetical protein